jgi:hypothetical protein
MDIYIRWILLAGDGTHCLSNSRVLGLRKRTPLASTLRHGHLIGQLLVRRTRGGEIIEAITFCCRRRRRRSKKDSRGHGPRLLSPLAWPDCRRRYARGDRDPLRHTCLVLASPLSALTCRRRRRRRRAPCAIVSARPKRGTGRRAVARTNRAGRRAAEGGAVLVWGQDSTRCPCLAYGATEAGGGITGVRQAGSGHITQHAGRWQGSNESWQQRPAG